MKKTITIIIGLFAIMCFSSSVYATVITWNNGATGGAVTIGTTGTTLTYTSSPGVIVSGSNNTTVYCIVTGNGKAGTSAMAYTVGSDFSTVGQDAVDLSTPAVATVGVPTSDGTMPTAFASK